LNGGAPQQLTVELTGVPSSWRVSTGSSNGSYSNGKWTITLPAGQDYDGGLTFTPPANSDVDLTGLTLKATSRNTSTNETETSSTSGRVIVDAVADTPIIDAGSNQTVEAGGIVRLNITHALRDTDGSEIYEHVGDDRPITITGVPSGATFQQTFAGGATGQAGRKISSDAWEFWEYEIANDLAMIVPSNAQGSYTLRVSVTAVEQVTDGEFRTNNNTATSSDTVCTG